MTTHEEALERLLAPVSEKVAESVRQAAAETARRELSAAIGAMMREGELYRHLSEEMRGGLRGIYKDIADAALPAVGAAPSAAGGEKAGALFSDAGEQLEEVMRSTLQATEHIMETVESLLDQQSGAEADLAALRAEAGDKAEAIARLAAFHKELGESLTRIITDLSFQDLTGQRLQKVVAALGTIKETVFDLYVSSGLMIKGKEEQPDKDIQSIAEQSRLMAREIRNSELKGPDSHVSQGDVDDLLAGLGL